MRVLITGAKGMLGRTVASRLDSHELLLTDVDEMDITSPDSLEQAFSAFQPEAVVHCAAMTQVDDCETKRELAFAINADGSRNVARAAAKTGARLVAISTDYVFSGDLDRPYREEDEPAPRTVYGASKLAGEEAVLEEHSNAAILRIAWLYGPGGPSFVHTMLRLLGQDGDPLRVVADQTGNPTSTNAVAAAVADFLENEHHGIVHSTCEGEATWFDLTVEIGRLTGSRRQVHPCSTDEFPRPAPRPANSRLENSVRRQLGLPALPHWRDELAHFLKTHPEG